MKKDDDKKTERFEFKIDGEILFAPREAMTIDELIDIALENKVLDPVEGGYRLEDGKGNEFAGNQLVHLEKESVFYSTEQEPGPASPITLG